MIVHGYRKAVNTLTDFQRNAAIRTNAEEKLALCLGKLRKHTSAHRSSNPVAVRLRQRHKVDIVQLIDD